MPKKKISRKKSAASGWQQIPGTFTYELFEPTLKKRFICHATEAMTPEQLNEQVVTHMILDPASKAGDVVEFKAVRNPMEAIEEMIKNPSGAWLATAAYWVSQAMAAQPKPATGAPGKTPPKGACPHCLGAGWVCEDHPQLPMETYPGGCSCGAPGEPCKTCNPKAHVFLGPGDFVLGPESCSACNDERWLASGKPCLKCNPDGCRKRGELRFIRPDRN